MNTKMVIFYHMWQFHTEAATYALEKIRKVYPTEKIVLLVDIADTSDLLAYELSVINLLKSTFLIENVNYLFLNSSIKGHFHPSSEIKDGVIYCDTLMMKMLKLIPDDVDYAVYATEDTHFYKQIDIDVTCDATAGVSNIGDWEPAIIENLLVSKFPNAGWNGERLWINHGDYFNVKKLKSVFTTKNRRCINDILTKNDKHWVFPDYYFGIWAKLCYSAIRNSSHVTNYFAYNDPNIHPDQIFEISETPVVHGYKKLYSTARKECFVLENKFIF